MKTTFLGALALCLSCSFASAQPAPGKTEAQLLVDKCRAAYANLKTYRGTVKTDGLSRVNGAENHYGGSAHVAFERPGALRIDGKLSSGGNFSILANESGSWYRWPVENAGKWKKADNLSSAVASMTGVAGGAPTNISALLLPGLGFDPFHFIDSAKIEAEEAIDGQPCYKLTAQPKAETISWWIDKKTLLLRRVLTSYDEKQSAAMTAKVEESAKEYAKQAGAPIPKIDMRFVSNVEDLKVEEINGVIEEKVFDMSDSLWPWQQNG